MTHFTSADGYRRAAGYRHSTPNGTVVDRPLGQAVDRRSVYAYQVHDLAGDGDPALQSFLRGGREAMTGIAVSDKMAMRNSVFFRASSLIAGSIGMLPLDMYRRKANGTTSKALDHPLHSVLKLDPLGNGAMTPTEFKSFMQLAPLLDGNAYARVVRLAGDIQVLVPFPRKTITKELVGGTLRFKHTPKDGRTEYLSAADVFHFRAPVSLDGLHGLGLLDVAADTIGLALMAERAMANLMRKGVMAGGALQTKGALSDNP